MKKLLIALDYSPSSSLVAEQGFQLADEMHADVVLVHVLADTTYYSSLNYSPITGFDSFNTMNVVQSSTEEELKEAAHTYLNSYREHYNRPAAKVIVKEGESANGILETAEEISADIIVLGTHSRRGIDKIIMGSVASQVLNKSEIPVFIVPVRGR
ncbi:MAG: universal stress protein [Chitinophagaceae bacterium]|nr:universal stress protein [Chitinophagaceae bacterium]